MSEFSGRLQYDDRQSEEDEAVADSCTFLAYRRLAASRAEPNYPHWPGAAGVSCSVSAGCARPTLAAPTIPQPANQSQNHNQILKGHSSCTPLGVGFNNSSSFEHNESPRFWSPFGNVDQIATQDGELEDTGAPCVIPFPSTFRLERANFLVTALSPAENLSLAPLLDALESALSRAGVDVLEFKPAHCVLECSFHVGNCFLSLFVRVFRAPSRASGELIDNGMFDDQEQAPFLVEVQHREGDRLHFTALYSEIVQEFKNQEGVKLAGTFRYRQRPYPAMGEGLALTIASTRPSRNSTRLLAERKESVPGVRHTLAESDAMAVGWAIPAPARVAKPETLLELDDDMMNDVVELAKMQRGDRLDVQANAATAAAGLTTNLDLLAQLSRDEALGVAKDLAAASARLLVESQHRPARRQAAVVVANLSTTPQLREALLASDPAASGDHSTNQSGLVESLVHLGVEGGSSEAMEPGQKEEEIGTRRECMRALVGLAKCQAVRDTSAMKLLLYKEPSGRGATDGILLKRLRECRLILRKSRS